MAARKSKDQARKPITRDEVVSAALEVIDTEGFHALSMRGVARKLGVYPTTLYWHAGTKAELLALVCERVLDEIEYPDDDLRPWQEWLFLFGVRARQVLGAHPRFAAYFVTNIQVSTTSLTMVEKCLAVLDRAGFHGEGAVRAYNAVMGSIFGWISGEFAAEPDDTDGKVEQEFRTQLAEVDRDTIRAYLPHLENRAYMMRWSSGSAAPMGSSFELMLHSLLLGLSAELERQQASA